MKIHLETGAGANIIRAYGVGQITVNDQTYARSLVLMPDRILDPWGPACVAELGLQDFIQIAELRPELVLLGTGLRQRFPDPAMTRPSRRVSVWRSWIRRRPVEPITYSWGKAGVWRRR